MEKTRERKQQFSFFQVLGGLIVLILVVIAAGNKDSNRIPSRSAPVADLRPEPVKSPAREQQVVIDDMIAWQQTHDKYLSRLKTLAIEAAKGDPESERIAVAFSETAEAVRAGPGGSVTSVILGDFDPTKRAVPVRLVDASELQFLPDTSFAFQYYHGMFTFIASEEMSDLMLGPLVLHESTHWYNCDVIRIADGDAPMYGDDYNAEEVRAYTREFAALDRATNGAFTQAISEALKNPALTAPLPGFEAARKGLPVPAESRLEQAFRDADIMFQAVFLQIDDPQEKARAFAWLANNPIPDR